MFVMFSQFVVCVNRYARFGVFRRIVGATIGRGGVMAIFRFAGALGGASIIYTSGVLSCYGNYTKDNFINRYRVVFFNGVVTREVY